jgi:hypothetical protein
VEPPVFASISPWYRARKVLEALVRYMWSAVGGSLGVLSVSMLDAGGRWIDEGR